MKFLRVALNSLVSGVFFSLLLSLLIADININLKPNLEFYSRLTIFITPLYGLALAFLFFLTYFLIQFTFGRSFRLKALSPSFLTLGFSFSLLFFLALCWLNYSFYRSFFSPETRSYLRFQIITSGLLVFVGLTVFWRYHRYRRRPVYFLVYFLLFFAGMGAMFWSRGRFPQPPLPGKLTVLESLPTSRRATLLSLEGLSFDFLIPLIHSGKLPNFSWLMENGSWGRLQTLSPTDPYILQQSLKTGKNPYSHRCLGANGFKLWGKEPTVEALPRFMLFKQLTRVGLLQVKPLKTQARKSIWDILTGMNLKLSLYEPEIGQETETNQSPKMEKIWLNFSPDPNPSDGRLRLVRQALNRDGRLEEKAYQEKTQNQPQVLALFLDGLNQVETYFYKYSFPQLFGNIDHEEINRYGQIIEKYYQFYDQLLGKYLANLKDEETLIVFSTHGMEPLPLWKRLVEWALGNPEVSGHYEFAPDGVIFFYGQAVLRGQSLEKIRLIDITPTLLYILGLPVARDMEGLVGSAVFRPEFSVQNPIFYISSYDEVLIKPSRR